MRIQPFSETDTAWKASLGQISTLHFLLDKLYYTAKFQLSRDLFFKQVPGIADPGETNLTVFRPKISGQVRLFRVRLTRVCGFGRCKVKLLRFFTSIRPKVCGYLRSENRLHRIVQRLPIALILNLRWRIKSNEKFKQAAKLAEEFITILSNS